MYIQNKPTTNGKNKYLVFNEKNSSNLQNTWMVNNFDLNDEI